VRGERPSLREVQQRFHALITAPEGVRAGLATLGLDETELARLVRGDGQKSAVDRLDVYANMYFFRIRDVLRDYFPSLAAALGDDGFHNAVTDYLVAYPPEHPSIRHAGARLPAFLDGHAPSSGRPWLAELARLEWARLQVFDAADAPLVTLEALRALPPDDFAALPLSLIPAHALVQTRFAADELWKDPARESSAGPERTLLVWRRDLRAVHRPIEKLELDALALAAASRPFGAVCDLVMERVPVDDAPRTAFELLLRWVSDGLLSQPD
jgi:hypothetical protein